MPCGTPASGSLSPKTEGGARESHYSVGSYSVWTASWWLWPCSWGAGRLWPKRFKMSRGQFCPRLWEACKTSVTFYWGQQKEASPIKVVEWLFTSSFPTRWLVLGRSLPSQAFQEPGAHRPAFLCPKVQACWLRPFPHLSGHVPELSRFVQLWGTRSPLFD